jgi:hypothetical protein
MLNELRIAHRAVAAGAALTFVAGVALADVTLQQKISVEGSGVMSAGNMSGLTKTTISGDRSRTDSDIQLKSRVVRMLAYRAVGPTAEIIRLDQGRIERLDLTRKQYTETTFEEMKARLRKATGSQPPMDDSRCEWLDPKADVRRPGEKATYAGFEAERLTIVVTQPCKDRQTGTVCDVVLSLDEWLAPQFASGAEAEQFHRAYASKIGLDLTSARGASGGDITERAQSLFGRYTGLWGEIAAKANDAKGYPVKTSFAFTFSGAQCKRVGSAQPLVTLTSELVSVSTDSVGPEVFEVPADFRKIERQGG